MTDDIEPIKFRKNTKSKDLPPDEREQAVIDWLASLDAAGLELVSKEPEYDDDRTVRLILAIQEVVRRSRAAGEESLSDEDLAIWLADMYDIVNRRGESLSREHINRARREMRRRGFDV